MKPRTHLIIAIIEFVIQACIALPIMPQRVTVWNSLIMLFVLIILAFSIIHIVIYSSSKGLSGVIFMSFKKFRSFRNISPDSYGMSSAMCAYYRFHNTEQNKLMSNAYNIFIYFKSVPDYFRYWIYRNDVKHSRDSIDRDKLYNKYIDSVKMDLEKFNAENDKRISMVINDMKTILEDMK